MYFGSGRMEKGVDVTVGRRQKHKASELESLWQQSFGSSEDS
jgi:hypothetical protein